jgi:hypothetical protein
MRDARGPDRKARVRTMPSRANLYPYQIAYLCGGPERVAVVALVALWESRQIKISPARHRVEEIQFAPRNPVEKAALEAIPDSTGQLLGSTIQAIADSAAVQKIGQALRAEQMLPDSRVSTLWQWGRIWARRSLRRRMTADPPPDSPLRVAALGTAGIADEKLRQIFETPDPPRTKIPKLSPDFPVDPFYANNAPAPWETNMY